MTNTLGAKSPVFHVPERVRVDQSFPIYLSGLPQGREVTIRAAAMDGERKKFESYAVFIADSEGRVDTGTHQPLRGTYNGTDAMGLLWSMKDTDKGKHSFLIKTRSTPLVVALTAEIVGQMVVEAEIERYFISPGVVKLQVEERDWIGSLYYPHDSAPVPGVLIYPARMEVRERKRLLCWPRNAALALPYFGVEDVPKDL